MVMKEKQEISAAIAGTTETLQKTELSGDTIKFDLRLKPDRCSAAEPLVVLFGLRWHVHGAIPSLTTAQEAFSYCLQETHHHHHHHYWLPPSPLVSLSS